MSSRFRWLPLVVAWTAFGLAQGLIRTAANASPAALLGVLAFDVPLALLWAAFTPVVGHWSAAVGRRTPSRALRVLAHVPLAVLAGLLYTLLRRSLAVALGNSLGVPFHVTLLFFADIVVASYVAAAWAARTMDAERARTVREQRTNLLRAQLSSARTQYLDLQLQPHFLFNTLGAISELAHEAPRSAARMIRNVIMLLQTAASRHERALVTLGEELDALQPYLEIQRLRFSDWLTIEESADVASRAALVPQFILQPLVENAVHHGLKGRTERGHIAIRARIASGRLVIEVMDNGVGLQV
ncbi:MAG: histidine kinase, partial [Gemmatimonadaceae bacterium]